MHIYLQISSKKDHLSERIFLEDELWSGSGSDTGSETGGGGGGDGDGD